MKKVTLFILTVGMAIWLCSCSSTKTYYCGAGKTDPVFVVTDINKVYPVFKKEYKSKLEFVIDNIEIGASHSDSIVKFRDELRNEYALMQDLLKMNYLSYVMRPCECDTVVHDNFYNMLHKLSDNIVLMNRYISEKDAVTNEQGGTKRSGSTSKEEAIIKLYKNFHFLTK